ncbi:MAG: ABC transporter substrate-binding protein [Acidimicrobiaceae bacterium]|nr:ABC transporter substrate-binding protein [Acidimicrobiaceae bacterium]
MASAAPKFKPVSNFAKYVGGHGKAKTNLSPVEVGIVNQQGGQNDIAPQWTIGAQVAADYINNQAGGIDGHPLKLVSCFIPDQVANATQCGQTFANTKAISGVAVGPVSIGNQAMEQAIAPTKKVLIFGVSTSPVDTTYKDGYIIYGDGTHIEAPLATFTKEYLHAKSVSIVWPNIPGESTGVDIIVDALKFEGVKTVDSVSYDPSSTDLTTPIEAAHVGKTDVFIADAPGGPACADMNLALKQLNIKTKVLANVPCDSPLVAKAEGGTLPIGWYYASAKSLPGDPSDPGLPIMAKIATTYGEAQWGKDSWWADGFGEMLTLAKWDTEVLKSGKTISPATLNATAKAFHGPVQGGSSTLECGAFKAAPAVCNDLDQFFQNTAPGVFKPIVRWIGPPAGFKLPANLE